MARRNLVEVGLVLVAVLALAGCVQAPPIAACGTVKEWSENEQAVVLAELDAMPPQSLTWDWVADYIRMRDEARACKTALDQP